MYGVTQVPFKVTGNLNELTPTMDRPKQARATTSQRMREILLISRTDGHSRYGIPELRTGYENWRSPS